MSLVGAGPGDPGLLTVKAARLIAAADVLIYDALASQPIVALAPATCEKIYVGKRARLHTMPQAEISALLVTRALAGARVVRLKGGDPFVFGRGGEEAQELFAAGVPFEIVPGISSALAAPAYAGIPVTHRSFNTNFTVATGHEDPSKANSTLDWQRLADGHGTSVFLMAMGHLAGIVAELQKYGRSPQTPAAVISDGTTPRQRTVVATLATIVDAVAQAKIGAPAVVVVGEAISVRDEVRWFDRQPLFGQRILITRPQLDGQELADALWELGAEPILAPLIEAAAPSDAQAFRTQVGAYVAGTRSDWLIFTSRLGVKEWFTELAAAGGDARSLAGTQIAAIGPGTASALQQYGIRVDLMPPDHRSEGLAEALIARLQTTPQQRILICTAQDGRDVLIEALQRAEHIVARTYAYRMQPTAAPDLEAQAELATIWTFTSGSTVEAFMRAVPQAAHLAADRRIVAIGPVTAQALSTAGLKVDGIAAVADLEGVLDALKTLFITSTPTAA